MSWKLRVLIPALLLAPQAAFGLGLGEIRLSSSLNEPLTAEIDLVAATPEELSTLQAKLAARELFQRYGLDRPAWLDSLEFRVGHGRDGQGVLLVRSRDPIAEPFVTFLVDVSWPRGHLLREYTVLLDPPVFAPPSAAVAAAPVVAPRSEAPAPQQPETSEPPPAAEARPAAAAEDSSVYRVQRGDTLYGIAGTLSGGGRAATQQMAIALFQSNPAAFNGNINLLRAGSILRVPAADDVAAVGPADAAAEISRQTAAWRDQSAVPEEGRLRLVTPPEEAAATAPGAPATQADAEGRVGELQREVDEQRRLLEVRNQELADLQRQLAEARAGRTGEGEAPAEPEPAAEALTPATEAQVAPEDDAGAPAPAPAAPAGPKDKPAAVPPAAEKPSFFARLTENWLIVLGAAALLLGGLLGYGYVRRRREEDLDEALKGFDVPATAPVPSETMRLRALATGAGAAAATPEVGQDIVVEERVPAGRQPESERPRPAVHDETISAEAALDLDQADPLAEADFHMAYGLYDQAADLIRLALRNEPDRTDLKLKLAEVHFVAGDASQFLQVARDLHKSIDASADWDRIVIMGRQIAPDDPLFEGAMSGGGGVDLSLEGGENRVDLELLSAPDGDGGLDIDFGEALAHDDSSTPTGEVEEIHLDLGDATMPPGAITKEIPRAASPGTVEMPTIEMPIADSTTVESRIPGLSIDDTLQERFRQPEPGRAQTGTDATAEMAIDDLGLDLSELPDALDDDRTRITRGSDATRQTPVPDPEHTSLLPEMDFEGTAMLPALDGGSQPDVDFDVGADLTRPASDATATERMAFEDLPGLGDLDPVTMSEVGTKLDLARAYMDMGDPEGARSILQEVLAEGSVSQKTEARRLIDSLPGA
ncbi:MAG: hypothetical protein EPO25_01105 [Gammaproteobacteria bacterium]|nr:MAG: hypothetical protein EPO25_01105 [Gammaproteobacteria bacterium]